jgi:lantibiotic modifying enzyme
VTHLVTDPSFSAQPASTELADRIADVIVTSAITDGRRATWPAAVLEGDGQSQRVVHRTGDGSLYQGSAGIAWACVEAAPVLGRDDLSHLARLGAWGALLRAREEDGTGLYEGLTGVGLVALVVGLQVGDAALSEAGCALLDRVASKPAAGPDLITGAAGVALGLLAATRVSGQGRWLPAAMWHGRRLVAEANRQPWGWSWPLPDKNEPGLCGLAHGAAGIAWALAEIHAASGDADCAEGCARAIQFERSWFDRRRNAWPDLRTEVVAPGSPPPQPTLWCHGAAGIGLSRLRINSLAPHPSLLAETAAALQSCVAAASEPELSDGGFGLTLCHGLGGTLELLASAHEHLGEEEHRITARWLLGRALAEIGDDVERWPSGLPGCRWAPGLMTGLAGTMLILLRLAHAGRLPGVGLILTQPGATTVAPSQSAAVR